VRKKSNLTGSCSLVSLQIFLRILGALLTRMISVRLLSAIVSDSASVGSGNITIRLLGLGALKCKKKSTGQIDPFTKK